MLPEELAEYFKSTGEQSFRAQQVFSWLHNGMTAFSDMTNLSLNLRNKLDNDFYITEPVLADKLVSKIDGTVKYLLLLKDSEPVECVLMEHTHGNTLCISTQVGCKMGCKLCASTLAGFKRNLEASEMLDQVFFAGKNSGKRVSNVVLMGIGEPLDNFDNVIKFIKLISDPKGLNIGTRHLTLSTCGLTENIDRLAEYDVQLTLAISLHAPDDETRSYLIPVNKISGIDLLVKSSIRYFNKTGRRVTFEYALIDGINDSPTQAEKLSKLINNTSGHLNLIKLNKVSESELMPASKKSIDIFTDILSKNKVNFTIRRSKGADIEAACGQLRFQRYIDSSGDVNGILGNN